VCTLIVDTNRIIIFVGTRRGRVVLISSTKNAFGFASTILTYVSNSVTGITEFDFRKIRENLISVAAKEYIFGKTDRQI